MIAAGPGVSLGLYARFKSLKSPARPNGLELLLAEGSGWLFARSRGETIKTCSRDETIKPCSRDETIKPRLRGEMIKTRLRGPVFLLCQQVDQQGRHAGVLEHAGHMVIARTEAAAAAAMCEQNHTSRVLWHFQHAFQLGGTGPDPD